MHSHQHLQRALRAIHNELTTGSRPDHTAAAAVDELANLQAARPLNAEELFRANSLIGEFVAAHAACFDLDLAWLTPKIHAALDHINRALDEQLAAS